MSESEIHALVEELRHAVHRLIDPRLRIRSYREVGTGDLRREVHRIPSILDEVTESLGGMEEGIVGQGQGRSIPPLWIDGLKFLREVDYEVRSWLRATKAGSTAGSTVEVLEALAEATWRPQDHRKVVNFTAQITRWVYEGDRLLAGSSLFPLRNTACPECGEKTVRKQNQEGQWGSVDALLVSVHGARCLACGRTWDSSMFRYLGKMLGCKSPEEMALIT